MQEEIAGRVERLPTVATIAIAALLALSGCLRSPRSNGNSPTSCGDVSEGSKEIYWGAVWLTYCEGRRGLTLGMDEGTPDGDRIAVPSEARWPKLLPEWAHHRRTEIIDTIRKLAAESGHRVIFDVF